MATEGDAFTVAFHDPLDAISWALEVQHRLLLLPWPEELLSHADAKEEHTPSFVPTKALLFRGLRVRMAMHTGLPDALQVGSWALPLPLTLLLTSALPSHILCFAHSHT